MAKVIEGAIYKLTYLGNRYRVMAIQKEKNKEIRVLFTNLSTGKTGSMEIEEFNKNFVEVIEGDDV